MLKDLLVGISSEQIETINEYYKKLGMSDAFFSEEEMISLFAENAIIEKIHNVKKTYLEK